MTRIGVLVTWVVAALYLSAAGSLWAVGKNVKGPREGPTFNRDIAPILFSQCVHCHHPGGIGPFSLATYAEARKRGKLIAKVTGSRIMPPWLPEAGHGEFMGERRLTGAEIALLEGWWRAGAPEGSANELVATSEWNDDWQLGKPDMVITLPEAYLLPATGKDVYRNFVISNIVPGNRFLRASEFRPGTTSALHHAFILLDHSGNARRRAALEKEPGFPGMDAAGASMPEAMFIGWQPGKRAAEAPSGMAAVLRSNTDLVLQLHMRPTGKPEKVQPSVALYFSQQAPTSEAAMILLRSVDMEIPAGAKDYAIENSYTLPVDIDVLAVLPHLHFLGKEVHAWAELPDGRREELIYIKQWDFNWQGDYRYKKPVFLPKGSTVKMRYTYDNSNENPRNPNQPPRSVTYGLQSSDEMGEMWLQVIPRNAADMPLLRADARKNLGLPDAIAFSTAMLRKDPKDATRRASLGAALAASGRLREALVALNQAIADDPNLARPYHVLGQIAMQQEDAQKAKTALTRAVELDPANAVAQSDLGWVLFAIGDAEAGIKHLEKSVELDPSDPLALRNLERARAARRQ